VKVLTVAALMAATGKGTTGRTESVLWPGGPLRPALHLAAHGATGFGAINLRTYAAPPPDQRAAPYHRCTCATTAPRPGNAMTASDDPRTCIDCGARLRRYNPADRCASCQRSAERSSGVVSRTASYRPMRVSTPGAAAGDNVGSLLREWRRSRNKTQIELSRLLGWTQQYTSQLELGRPLQSIDQRWHIATTLGIAPHELGLSSTEDYDEAAAPVMTPAKPVPAHTRLGGSVRAAPGQIQADGFVPINTWSAGRPLRPENLDLMFVGEHPDNLANPHPGWNAAREGFVAAGRIGSVASVSGLRAFDYRDAPGQELFGLDLARIDYAAQLATRNLLAANRMLREGLQSLLMHEGLDAFLAQAPPSAVAANINVVSADRQALIVQRSAMVATYPSQWNLGINETMNYYSRNEDFFGLIGRGLAEEVGLEANDLGGTVVSWFGYCFDCGNFYLFAHATAKLTAVEIIDQISESRDSYEHSDLAWSPMSAEDLQGIVNGGPAPDASTRWLHHARLSALELWRIRKSL
jgi:hypothetical protein